MATWGIVSTILAPTPEVLRFVAYHLELGAHRVYVYLDADAPETYAALKAHPKVRVQTCTEAWWIKRNKKRPVQHQVRQSMNATQTYRRKADVDWLGHIDVDEFISPARPVSELLGALPNEVNVARIRPMESLADGDGRAYKAYIPPGPAREDTIARLYPTFGPYLRAGFISHSAGKIFVRTGHSDVSLRIHKAFQREAVLGPEREMAQIDLAHQHAPSWQNWRERYAYRMEHGAYRAVLDPGRKQKSGSLTLNELFNFLEESAGEDGLRSFYEEVTADTPRLREKLDQEGLLRIVDLDLNAALHKHFSDSI